MHTITLQDDISLDQWDEEEQEGLKLQGEQQQQQQQQMPWLSPHAISPKSVDEDMDKAYSRGRGGRKGGLIEGESGRGRGLWENGLKKRMLKKSLESFAPCTTKQR
jgi:hypothetical protein